MPDGFQAEFTEAAERGRTGFGKEDSVEHVEVFRMGSAGRTSILEDPGSHPPNTPDYTSNCEESPSLNEWP